MRRSGERARRLLGIGLPAGVEFGLIAVYLGVDLPDHRPAFGADAQAGFGVGCGWGRSCFLPVDGTRLSPSRRSPGRASGARLAGRMRETFRLAALLSVSAAWRADVAVCQLVARRPGGASSRATPTVVARRGEEFLRIISWNYVAMGLVSSPAGMFQAMGNTKPSLVTSLIRAVVVSIPSLALSRVAGFQLTWVWYFTVASVTLQMLLGLWLLKREFRLRLTLPVLEAPAPVAEPVQVGAIL